ncbi:hypothetical protein EDD22DRAFT_907092 [Suillus occidentalis]|nr:hypothetical protein EDD22DRAFT_907092 [Suillus occidentalis]
MNVITLSATDFPIKSVKIFSSDVAEVTRVFPLDFTQSPNESQAIEISNLPLLHSGTGIRASVTIGSDDLLVTDYYHCSSDYKSNLFGHPVSSDVLRDLQAEFTRLDDERQLRQQSFAFLSTYMNSLAKGEALAGAVEPAQLVTFFNEFVDIGKSRSEVIAVLDQQVKDVQKDIEKEIQRLSLESRSLATKATVTLAPVSGHTATIAELELKYRVSATWKPVYEIHVTTTDSIPSSSVVLTYRCQISQSTGENWDNVELAVTTAKHHVHSVGLPEPKKMEIRQQQGFLSQPDSYRQPAVNPQRTPVWNTPGYTSPFVHILSSAQQASPSVFGSTQTAPHEPGPSQGSIGTTQRSAMDSVFGSKRQPTATTPSIFASNLAQSTTDQSQMFGALQGQPNATPPSPSNFESQLNALVAQMSGSSHISTQSQASSSSTSAQSSSSQHQRERAVLAELDKAITHTATSKVLIPSREAGGTHHILLATIPLKASFTRVAVPSVDSRVFWTCEITNTSNYVLTPGTIHTYLDGKHISDSNIMVTTQFHRIVGSLPDFSVFNGKAVTTHTITTTIKNTHRIPVRNVIVRTSLPLPADPRVTVSLQEPEGLADIDSGTVRVGDGCYAGWSTTGDRAGKNDGLFEWVCSSVEPGSRVLKAVWYVTAPRGLSFTEQ